MRIPLTWLKDYLDLDKSPQEIADSFTTLGLMLDKPIEGNVLELEQRLNRSDLLSVLGCARDLAAFEGVKLKESKIPHPPLKQLPPGERIKLKVTTPTVRRFNTRIIKNLQVTSSPPWLKNRLLAYGIDPKNNVVDITNFVMLELGQTLHAQDLAKLPKHELCLKDSRGGESITTLLGTKVIIPKGIYIMSSGNLPCVIGGIVGGIITGVTDSTTDIILDAGNYNQRDIRTNSRMLKIFNESVIRNDKFVDPRMTEVALDRATDLILQLAGGTAYDNEDYYPHPVKPRNMRLTYSRLKLISGLDIPPHVTKSRLKRLGYIILTDSPDSLELEIPVWRTDIEVEDDLISDVLRIGNYREIPTTPLTTPVPPDITKKLTLFEDSLRDHLVALGAHEHITSPLVESSGLLPRQIKLENALSTEQNALRTTLRETLTPLLTTYHKHGLTNPLLFEIAKSFTLIQNKPVELRELTVVSSADVRPQLTALLSRLGIPFSLQPSADHTAAILTGKQTLGTLTPNSFTLDTSRLLPHVASYTGITTTIPHYTSLDLSLVLPAGMPFSHVEAVLRKTSNSLHSIKVLEHYQAKNSLLIRLTWTKLSSPDQTRLSLIKALKAMGVVSRSG